MKFIDLELQYKLIAGEVDRNISQVLAHGQYIMGPEVLELEKRLALFVEAKYCMAVSSGTDALLIAMMALGVGVGDEIITTPFTFIAAAEVIALLGAKPVFADIDPKTYNIDHNKIEGLITSKTRAILAVALYGQPACYDEINEIAVRHNIPVIEDAAQSFGSTYKGRSSCNLTTIACTSFFPSKPLGCYGDGGACFTNDENLAQVMAEIRLHGQKERYHHTRLGINGRIDTLQAAILLAKLELFAEEIKLRKQIGEKYTQRLKNSNCIVTPCILPGNRSVYAQYTIQVDGRDQLRDKLESAGVPTAVHYPIPLHKQPIFAQDYKDVVLPESEKVASRVVSLPMHPYLREEDQDYICQKVIELVS